MSGLDLNLMIKALTLLIAVAMMSSASLLTVDVFAEYATCTTDCEAPTLGLLDSGRKIVENGITINGRTSDVGHFTQTVTTTWLNTGDTVNAKLTIHENSGVDAIRQVSLSVADYVDDQNRNELATISFHQAFNGVQSVSVTDLQGILKEISVKPTRVDPFQMTLEFTFKIVKPVVKSAIIVDMSDAERNSKRNVFIDAIAVAEDPVAERMPDLARKIIPSPLKQVKAGTMPQNVECRTEMELVFRTSSGAPMCVYPLSAETLRSLGLVR